MSNIDKLKEGILTAIDREVKISKVLNEDIDQEWIDKLTEQFIELLKKEIEDYE